MQANYVPFVNGIMIPKYEGGYCWDKGDPGGPTNYGVTCFDLAEERHQQMNSMAAWAPLVKAMSLSEADTIYATKYKGDFDDLPSGSDVVEFDYKVNSGIGRVVRVRKALLQHAGKSTVQECNPTWYVNAICDERQAFLTALGERKPQFKNGWLARVANLRTYCTHLAAGTQSVGPTSQVSPGPKANHTDPNLGTHVGTTIGAHGAGVGTAIHQGLSLHAAIALGLVGVAGIALWAAWRAHQNEVLNQKVVLPSSIPPHP